MTIEKMNTRVVQCTDCDGTGEMLSTFHHLMTGEGIGHDCEECDGVGMATLHFKQCACSRAEWMHKDYSTCSHCIEESIQTIVSMFHKEATT